MEATNRGYKHMRCLYYCTTPFQVLMALNMRFNHVVGDESTESDIVLVDIFKTAKELHEKLKAEQLYDNVYLIAEEEHKSHPNNYKKALGIARDTFIPKRLLKQQFGSDSVDFLCNKYDFIVSSVFCHPVAALLTVNPKSKYIMMDDGLASYFGDWTKRLRSNGYLKMLKFRNKGKDITKPEKLYVMNSELCSSDLTSDICDLPKFSSEFIKIAFRVFDIPQELPTYSQDIIWLSHVSNNADKIEGTHRIAELLTKYQEDVIVRVHPREKELGPYLRLALDTENVMWELLLSGISLDKKLIITLGSTGAFTPTLLYDEQPWLLFAYNLIKLPNNSQTEDVVRIVSMFKHKYKNPNHIFEPKSWDELEHCIEEFKASNSDLFGNKE